MTEAQDPRRRAMAASLAVAVLMLVGKLTAALLTGSSAILSDALESVIHIIATGLAAFSLWFSTQPPDREHPYGHGKFAYFSAGFEGALIMIAALFILYVSVNALIHGPELRSLDLGVAITGSLALVNLALGLYLVQVGKKHNALVIVANGRHVLTDVWTSGAVVVGVLLVWLTGWSWLDPVVAMLAALNILRAAGELMGTSFGGLMERASAEDTAALVAELQAVCREGLIADFHQLRHRRVSDQVHVELHALLPGGLSLREAHAHVSEVEERLKALFPRDLVVVTTHMEPEEHEKHHPQGHPEFPEPLS